MAERRTIDVTGVPESVVADLRSLVEKLRTGEPAAVDPTAADLTPEQRVAAWRDWVESHRDITAVADDSRESIYEGR